MGTGNRIDVPFGKVYGKLKALSEAKPDKNRVRRINVLCLNCNKESTVYLRSLSANPISCKYCKTAVYRKYQDKDLIGKKIGKLTILKTFSEIVGKVKVRKVVCNCDCGKLNHITRLNSVMNGTALSCGCLRAENNKKPKNKKKKTENRRGEKCSSCLVYYKKPHGHLVLCDACRDLIKRRNRNDPLLKLRPPIYKEVGE